MEAVADAAYDVGSVALAGGIENFDLSFLPKNLTTQCQSLIVSYHELHGYACLPNVLWKARLGHFIEAHQQFRQLPQKGFNDQEREEIQRRLCRDSDDDTVA